MKPQSFRQSAMLAAVFTLVWAVISQLTQSHQSLVTTLISLPVFFAIILLTMRATNRITVVLYSRFGPKPTPPPEPLAPSTDRPEHVQRLRERRRRRSSGSRRGPSS